MGNGKTLMQRESEMTKKQKDTKTQKKKIRFWSRVFTLIPAWMLSALIYFSIREVLFPKSESMLGTYALLIVIWQGLTSWVYRYWVKEETPPRPASSTNQPEITATSLERSIQTEPSLLSTVRVNPPERNKGCLFKGLLISAVIGAVLAVTGIIAWQMLISWGENYPDNFPLHIAAAQGNLDEIQSLVAQGHDVNEEESFMHSTPLIAAVSSNRAAATKLLLKLGADPEKKDRKQWAPLHSAVTYKRASCEAMEVLLKAGANVDVRDKHLRTPLHRAAQFGKIKVVFLLLKYRADPLAKDENGLTPIDRSIGQVAESARNPEIARILKEAAKREK